MTATKTNPVRRTAAAIQLPSGGYKGPIPKWPLADDIAEKARLKVREDERDDLANQLESAAEGREANQLRFRYDRMVEQIAILQATIEGTRDREHEIWNEVWRTPQAEAWSRLLWTREVAIYCRLSVKGELGSLDAGKEARMLADRLGLTPKAMQDLRWVIVSDEMADKRGNDTASSGWDDVVAV